MREVAEIIKTFAIKNDLGFWVGGVEYSNGTRSLITNAKHTECEAIEIAQEFYESNKRYITRQRAYTPCYH